jgi:quercetin dioxygenase-like cupin family protein
MATATTLPPAEAHSFQALLGDADHGIASRVLARTGGGNATFEKGQALSEHTSPFDALVFVLDEDICSGGRFRDGRGRPR